MNPRSQPTLRRRMALTSLMPSWCWKASSSLSFVGFFVVAVSFVAEGSGSLDLFLSLGEDEDDCAKQRPADSASTQDQTESLRNTILPPVANRAIGPHCHKLNDSLAQLEMVPC